MKTAPANARRSLLENALNLVLALPDDGECPALLISCGIIDLGAFCVELWSFFVKVRFFIAKSCLEHIPKLILIGKSMANC